jgi:hypothetical protein
LDNELSVLPIKAVGRLTALELFHAKNFTEYKSGYKLSVNERKFGSTRTANFERRQEPELLDFSDRAAKKLALSALLDTSLRKQPTYAPPYAHPLRNFSPLSPALPFRCTRATSRSATSHCTASDGNVKSNKYESYSGW